MNNDLLHSSQGVGRNGCRAYAYSTSSYELAGFVFDELHRPVDGVTVRHPNFTACTDSSGRFILQIVKKKPDAEATLRFSMPYSQSETAPDRAPLWHFNSQAAIWEQEGWSFKNGATYERNVKHLYTWNCDWPTTEAPAKAVSSTAKAIPLVRVRYALEVLVDGSCEDKLRVVGIGSAGGLQGIDR